MPYAGGQWVNWQDIFALNQPQATQMAQGLGTQLDTQAQDAQNAINSADLNDPASLAGARAKQTQATGQLAAAGEGGLAGLQALQPSHSIFDAALTGQAAGNQYRQLESKWAGLRDSLANRQAAAQNAPAPGATPHPPQGPAPAPRGAAATPDWQYRWRHGGQTIDPTNGWGSFRPEQIEPAGRQTGLQQIDPNSPDPWQWMKHRMSGGG